MKNKIGIILLMAVLLSACFQKKDEALDVSKQILQLVQSELDSISTMEYDVKSFMLFMGHTDTMITNAHCYTQKDSMDKAVGYYYRIDLDTSRNLYGKAGAFWETPSGCMLLDKKTPKHYLFQALSNIRMYKHWLKHNDSYPQYLGIDTHQNRVCWVIKINRKVDSECTEIYNILYIDTLQRLPIRGIEYFNCLGGMTQYKEYHISNLQCDVEIDDDLFLPTTPEIIDRKINYDSLTIAIIGKAAPEWTLQKAEDTTQTLSLSDFKGKVVLLDFWYMSCYPCIKAIPEIKKLKQKYQGQLEILAINSFDKNKLDLLREFIEKKEMNYTILLGDRELDKQYFVPGYPSFYLIDKKGKIAYMSWGYGSGMVHEFSVEINKLLKN